MKVIITGGHLTPALAYIDYIQQHSPEIEIVFVGRMYSQKKSQKKAQEQTEVEKRGVRFIALESGKLQTHNPVAFFLQVLPFIKALLKAIHIVSKEQPSIHVSFGSYMAVPVATACWLLRIPVVTHEQTRTLGVANSYIMHLAKAIAVSFPETKNHSPTNKTILTGNLLRSSILVARPNRPEWMNPAPKKPILYITGGSQGSEIINTTVTQCIKTLLKDWTIIHQCGASSMSRDYKKDLEQIRSKLPSAIRHRYLVREWVTDLEQAWIYTHAYGVISRAGANTVMEIAHFHIPSILIPLPFSHKNEQYLNAEFLHKKKQAILLSQAQLTPEKLIQTIQQLNQRHPQMVEQLKKGYKTNTASQKFHTLVCKYAKKT